MGAIADNVPITAGSGTNIATDDVGGVQHQRVKVEFGADGSATDVSAAAPLPTNTYGISDGGFVPEPAAKEPDAATGEILPVRVSAGGELVTRATISTDEGHFRHDFPGSALATAITGTNVTLTSGSAAMTGTGTSFTTQLVRGMFVKLNADAETAWALVKSVESDTAATLVSNYSGTGGTGAASFSHWDPTTGTGGSLGVSSSILTIGSGTTISARTNIWRLIDFAPMRVSFFGVSVSQRIANQVGYVGLRNAETSPTEYAEFQFDGTTNTTVKCVTTSDGATVKTTTVTIPYVGGTTTSNTSATAALYEIEVQRERVTFLIAGQVVATHDTHIPNCYTPLGVFVGWINGGSAPASNTNLTLDDIFVRNTSIAQVAADFTGNPIPVELRPSAELLVQAQPIAMTATNNIAVVQLNGRASQLVVELSGTFTGTVTFEALFADQGVWTAHTVYVSAGTGVTTATAVGRWMVPCAGLRAFRVRSSTSGTGTANASMQVAAAGNTVVQLATGTASIGTVTATGVAGSVADDAVLSGNPVRVGGRATNADPTAMSADGDMVTVALDRKGQAYTLPGRAATASLSRVNDAATSTSLLASNTSRKGVIIHNDSTSVLYLKYGATASTTSYTYKIPADGTWEMPAPIFTGALDGIWSADASGAAQITELTA